MRVKGRYLLFWSVFFLFSMSSSALQARRVRIYKLHSGPGMKFRVVGTVRSGEPVEVLEERAGWVKIQRRNGKVGWVSQRLFQRGWKRSKSQPSHPALKVMLKFQNIPRPCVAFFTESLKELQRRLMPVGDKELELVISAEPRLHSYRLFLIIDFNPRYYRRTMKRFTQPETIDLLPYNACIWAMYAYKQALVQAIEDKGASCTFVRRLSICLVLRKLSGEEVILQTVEDGVYIYFSPVLIMKRADGRSFRIVSEEPKKVGILSAFTLPYPSGSGTDRASEAYDVYRFFRSRP